MGGEGSLRRECLNPPERWEEASHVHGGGAAAAGGGGGQCVSGAGAQSRQRQMSRNRVRLGVVKDQRDLSVCGGWGREVSEIEFNIMKLE